MSQQEAWVIYNEKELRLEKKYFQILRGMELPWLEAFVLFHHYWRGLSYEQIADLGNFTVYELEKANDRMIGRFGVALGYVAPEEAGVKVKDSEWARRRRRIRSMYESGFPMDRIRREVKMSVRNVKKELADMGLG